MENKLKILWLIFIFIVLLIVQQCSVMIISKPNAPVNIDYHQKPDVDVTGKEKNKIENDTISPIGLY